MGIDGLHQIWLSELPCPEVRLKAFAFWGTTLIDVDNELLIFRLRPVSLDPCNDELLLARCEGDVIGELAISAHRAPRGHVFAQHFLFNRTGPGPCLFVAGKRNT